MNYLKIFGKNEVVRCIFKLVKILILTLICLTNLLGQYRIDNWTTENGLPQNTVRGMTQTSDGYLWLSTLDGIVRFDGVRFTVFNKANSKGLLGNRFISIFADTDDTLWFGTEEKGLVRYRNGEFVTFTMDGLSSNTVLRVRKGFDGNLYAYTVGGLVKLEENGFVSVSTREEMIGTATHLAKSGAFWELGESFLSVTRNGQKSTYELPPEIKKDVESEPYRQFYVYIFEDRHGNLWIATNRYSSSVNDGKLYIFSDGKFTKQTFTGTPKSLVNEIVEDTQGNVWLATRGDGACRLSGNSFTCLNAKNGLGSNSVQSFLTDREGTFWITTEDHGIIRLTDQLIESFSTEQGLKNKNVYPILADKSGGIWMGSLGGLAYYKDGKITNYSKSDDFTFVDVQSLFEDSDGRLWIGTYNGVQYFENGKFYYFKPEMFQKMDNGAVSDIHQDKNGVLWFATNGGLIRFDGQTTRTFTTNDGLPANNIKTILENADGSLWLGTFNGLALLKNEKFTIFSEKDGLAGNYVRSLYKDNEDTLWIGTYDSGLSRYKEGKFTRLTLENGLSSNGAFQIMEDSRNYFWISSNQGIYRVSREELNEFADGQRESVHSTLYGKSDGMLNPETNGGGQPSGIKTSDGKLWFPTQEGIAIVNPEAVKVNKLPPSVIIETARIDNQKLESLATGIELIPGQDNLEIDYTGLTFIKPEQVRFRYRFEGIDEKWTDAGTRRTAFFPRLAPGEYVFQVIAGNSDNVWNETGQRLKISVLPPFYQTWWFMILSFLTVSALAYSFYRRRIFQVERQRLAQQKFSRQLIASQETERKRIAGELHDGLGQRLVVIKNLAWMFLNAIEKNDQKQIEEISEEATLAIREVKTISYNLRPYQLDRLGLTNSLKDIIDSAQTASEIEFISKIDNIDDYFEKDNEINFYRIVQESVNNIIKHSKATKAEIRIKKKEKALDVMISDNGQGFQMDEEFNPKSKIQNPKSEGGFGLIGIKERIDLLGGSFQINNLPGKGTEIRITITK